VRCRLNDGDYLPNEQKLQTDIVALCNLHFRGYMHKDNLYHDLPETHLHTRPWNWEVGMKIDGDGRLDKISHHQ
jgi:hypothetical protein